jgi:hypothetical protein
MRKYFLMFSGTAPAISDRIARAINKLTTKCKLGSPIPNLPILRLLSQKKWRSRSRADFANKLFVLEHILVNPWPVNNKIKIFYYGQDYGTQPQAEW